MTTEFDRNDFNDVPYRDIKPISIELDQEMIKLKLDKLNLVMTDTDIEMLIFAFKWVEKIGGMYRQEASMAADYLERVMNKHYS